MSMHEGEFLNNDPHKRIYYELPDLGDFPPNFFDHIPDISFDKIIVNGKYCRRIHNKIRLFQQHGYRYTLRGRTQYGLYRQQHIERHALICSHSGRLLKIFNE